MNASEDCNRIRNAYLDQVEKLGKATPILFDARRAVENYDARAKELRSKISLGRAESAAVAGATRVPGPIGGPVAAVIAAVGSAEKIARLEAQLETEELGLANAISAVKKLEQEIRGYQWGIEHTPEMLARQGCPPL